MNELWYKFKFAIQEDFEKMTHQRNSRNAGDVLNETITEAEQQTKAVGKLLERQRLLLDEIQKELQVAKQFANKRTTQLTLAEATGEETLIRYAQDEANSYITRCDKLRQLASDTTESMIDLERKFESMKHRVKDMHVRRLKLMGEENTARAHHRMDQVFSTNWSSSMEEFKKNPEGEHKDIASMRQRLENLSAEEADITKIV